MKLGYLLIAGAMVVSGVARATLVSVEAVDPMPVSVDFAHYGKCFATLFNHWE